MYMYYFIAAVQSNKLLIFFQNVFPPKPYSHQLSRCTIIIVSTSLYRAAGFRTSHWRTRVQTRLAPFPLAAAYSEIAAFNIYNVSAVRIYKRLFCFP